MKRLLACLLVISPVIAAGEKTETANQLLDDCKSQSEHCSGYIRGLADGYQLGVTIGMDVDRIDNQTVKRINDKVGHCFPEGVTIGQMRDVFVKYATDNPKDRHQPAVYQVLLSWRSAWPCS